MERATVAALAGLTASALSLLALAANEGAFFSGETERIQLNVSAFDCAADGDDHVLKLGLDEARFLEATADLVFEVDLAPYAARGCETFEIRPRRDVTFTLTGDAYARTDHRFIYTNPAKPEDLSRVDCDCLRLEDPDGDPGALEAVLPGALRRVAPDAYAVRVGVGGVGETPILGAYGLAGYVAKDGWEHDVVFQLDQFTRIVSMTSIVFATVLGIGVGALFEASLSLATGRRLSAFGAALRRRRRSGRQGDDGGSGETEAPGGEPR